MESWITIDDTVPVMLILRFTEEKYGHCLPTNNFAGTLSLHNYLVKPESVRRKNGYWLV